MTDQHDLAAPGAIAAPPREGRRPSGRGRGRDRSGGSGAGVAASTLLAVLCVALAAGGWFIFNHQRQLGDADRELASASQRIAALEDRLRMTDETLSETDAETDDKLSFWETEIRKVWDIANKRNKNWIEQNRASIKTTSNALDGAQADLTKLKGTVARLDTSVRRQQEIQDLVTALDMRLQSVQKAQRELVDKVNVAARTASSLEDALESRVRENEEAIAAIDGSRTTVTNQLRELKDAVAELDARLSAPSGSPAFTN